MSMQDGRTILATVRASYPESADFGVVVRESGLDRARFDRAVQSLLEAGLLEIGGDARARFAPPELRLTEAGMAVASGIVPIEHDASAAIAALEALEALVLRDLRTLRANRRARACSSSSR